MTQYLERMTKKKKSLHEGLLKYGEEGKHPNQNLLGEKLEAQRQPKSVQDREMQSRMSACNKNLSTESLLEGEMMELPDFLGRTGLSRYLSMSGIRSMCGKTIENAAGQERGQDILLSVGLCLSFRLPENFNPVPASGDDRE